MPLILLLLVLLGARSSTAEEFTGEVYLVGASVADNGSSGVLPSRFHTATQFLDFPSDFGPHRFLRVELATLPAFGDLSDNVTGAIAWSIDGRTRMNAFGSVTRTTGIEFLPILPGTPQDRLNDPSLRPDCESCGGDRHDYVSVYSLNFMRRYDGYFPRLGIGSRPIPLAFTVGATTKYFYEELSMGGYEAQNLNMDLGATLKLQWGFDPIARTSDRDIKLQIAGFEVLPTRQRAFVDGYEVHERMDSRWRLSLAWEEGLPTLQSFVTLGVSQRSEGGKWPGFGAEWDLRRMLYLRGGWDGEFLSLGATVAYRLLSVHYAFRHHELGTTLYQVSAQVDWP